MYGSNLIKFNLLEYKLIITFYLLIYLAMFVLGPLGTLSDRKGRKRTLLISSVGTMLNTLNLILVSKFYDKVGINAYLTGSFIDGVTGGFYALSEASYAYATDCTHPTRR